MLHEPEFRTATSDRLFYALVLLRQPGNQTDIIILPYTKLVKYHRN